MQPEFTRDPERERLRAALVDMEVQVKGADAQAEHFRELALVAEAEARDLRETMNGMRRHLERLDRQSADHLVLLPQVEDDPAPIGINPSPPPRREEGVLAIISRDVRTWTYQELQDEFVRRGWNNPKAKHEIAAIRAAIYRLSGLGRVELGPGRGEFRIKMPPTTTPDSGGGSP